MKKFFSIFIAMILIFVFMIACSNTVDITDSTGLTDFIETIWTTMVETEVPTTITETEQTLFDPNITFTYKYISNGKVMSHLLYTPSTAKESESIPLIVWLHGKGSKTASESWFSQTGLPKVLNEWTLDGFNAYVLCPHLHGKWSLNDWCGPTSVKNLKALLDTVIGTYNIDTENIVIIGHSMGGYGAMYMAYYLPEYFSKLVVLSGYPCNIDLSKITIPTIGYVGTSQMGEDSACIKFMKNMFIPTFGEENAFNIDASHVNLPRIVFNEDKNNNNRSDLIEWMFDN